MNFLLATNVISSQSISSSHLRNQFPIKFRMSSTKASFCTKLGVVFGVIERVRYTVAIVGTVLARWWCG